MNDAGCVSFLQWALPRMGMRWKGFRRVRRQVCRRVRRRVAELGLEGSERYAQYLEDHPEEWSYLESLCRVTISRFRRDRRLWDVLVDEVLPAMAEKEANSAGGSSGCVPLRAWSAGCASGEEPYTLALLWHLHLRARFPDTELRILATDTDPAVLERARRARYPASALRELEPEWWDRCFEPVEDEEGEESFMLREEVREGVEFRRQDVRRDLPAGPFHLIFCRNLLFTYYDEPTQAAVLDRLITVMLPGAALLLGRHEGLPPGPWPLEERSPGSGIFRLRTDEGGDRPTGSPGPGT